MEMGEKTIQNTRKYRITGNIKSHNQKLKANNAYPQGKQRIQRIKNAGRTAKLKYIEELKYIEGKNMLIILGFHYIYNRISLYKKLINKGWNRQSLETLNANTHKERNTKKHTYLSIVRIYRYT